MIVNGKANNPFVSAEESLLVIIDMQERLLPAVGEQEKIVANTRRLLAMADTFRLPVIVTEQEKLGQTIAELREKVPHFEPVSKICFNCFFCEPFAARIREMQRNALIVAGIEAHICVTQTALWAQSDFRVQVVEDAISSRSPHNVAIAVERMRAAGVTVTSTEMIIYELLRKAGTPEFKAMLPYIK
jgi:nicotinamidase-related amidase